MKLSFSTKGWHNKSFDEFCNIARELKFGGIELHNQMVDAAKTAAAKLQTHMK